MMVLLVLKERLKAFYGRFAPVVHMVCKAALAFAALWMLNKNIGFMARLCSWPVMAVIAAVSAFLPYGAITVILSAVMLAHLYTVSLEMALMMAVFLVIVALLYYGFQPGDSYWLLLTPLAFALRIPFVIPLLAGLAGSLVSVVPVSCGIVVYYIISYVKQNAGILTNDASVDIAQKYMQLIRGLISNESMMVFIASCAVGILIVCLISKLSVDYAWVLAIVFGMVGQLAVIFAGDVLLDISVPLQGLLLGIPAALLVAGVYHFFVFAVDYSRTEYLQFEDDDYVYYVKAVPKIAVTTPDVKVQRINNPARPVRRSANRQHGN